MRDSFCGGEKVGLLDGLMGNASEIDPARIEGDFAQVLSSGERIEKAYQLIRDLFVFTNKRLVLVDKQGMTGRKVEYHRNHRAGADCFSCRGKPGALKYLLSNEFVVGVMFLWRFNAPSSFL